MLFLLSSNSPRFYTELKDASIGRFRVVVGGAFGFTSCVYVIMTLFGFLTFGGNCDGYILNNYSVNDNIATVCRIAIAFAILFTYPLTFMGARDGLLDIIQLPLEQQTSTNVNIISVVFLSVITGLASVITDLGYVNAVGGGTLAAAIVFVFPYLMFSAALKSQSIPLAPDQRMERTLAFALLIVGVALGVIGVIVELYNT
jgi:amino acid permease